MKGIRTHKVRRSYRVSNRNDIGSGNNHCICVGYCGIGCKIQYLPQEFRLFDGPFHKGFYTRQIRGKSNGTFQSSNNGYIRPYFLSYNFSSDENFLNGERAKEDLPFGFR